jgi:hypothetical protein
VVAHSHRVAIAFTPNSIKLVVHFILVANFDPTQAERGVV